MARENLFFIPRRRRLAITFCLQKTTGNILKKRSPISMLKQIPCIGITITGQEEAPRMIFRSLDFSKNIPLCCTRFSFYLEDYCCSSLLEESEGNGSYRKKHPIQILRFLIQ